MSRITAEEIDKVANLSRLEFTGEEARVFADQLSQILDYARSLEALDTEGIEPTSHCLELTNVLRVDEARASLTTEEALANAAEIEGQYFKVPSIIQESS